MSDAQWNHKPNTVSEELLGYVGRDECLQPPCVGLSNLDACAGTTCCFVSGPLRLQPADMLATAPCHLGQSIMSMSQLEERNEPGLKASRHTHKGGACSATLDSLLADFCLEVTHVDCVTSSPRTSFISARHALRMACEWRTQKKHGAGAGGVSETHTSFVTVKLRPFTWRRGRRCGWWTQCSQCLH